MAKRFITTELFEDAWFMDLSSKYKLFWIYLITKCNPSGIWQVNWKLAQFYVGDNLEPVEVKRILSERIVELEEGKYWFIPKFIEFQYGDKLSKSNKALVNVINILEKYNLFDYLENSKIIEGASKGLGRSKEGDKVQVQDMVQIQYKDKVQGSIIKEEKIIEHPLQGFVATLSNVSRLKSQLTAEECKRLLNEYDERLIKEILEAMDNHKPLTKKYESVNRTLRNWIKIRLEKENGTNRQIYSRGKGAVNQNDTADEAATVKRRST